MPPPKQNPKQKQNSRQAPRAPVPQKPKRRVFTSSELEVIRKDLLVDAKAKELAGILKIPIEQYADKVLEYLRNPNAPVWKSYPDAALRKMGFKVPSMKEVEKRLKAAAKSAMQVLKVMKTAFVKHEDKSERLGANIPAAAPVDQATIDPELLAEVSKKRSK
jgi:hypothetical protein